MTSPARAATTAVPYHNFDDDPLDTYVRIGPTREEAAVMASYMACQLDHPHEAACDSRDESSITNHHLNRSAVKDLANRAAVHSDGDLHQVRHSRGQAVPQDDNSRAGSNAMLV